MAKDPAFMSYNDWQQASRKANSPSRQFAIQEAEKKQFEAKSQYNRRLLTPLDYAEQCYLIWSECEQKLRYGGE